MTGVREVLVELGTWVRTAPRWAGRYIWWVQVVGAAVCAAVVLAVWRLAGGDWSTWREPGPWAAAGVAFVGMGVVTLLTELEARVTERARERARLSARHGVDLGAAPATIPDGWVLAFEVTDGDPLLGHGSAPTLVVAAIPADRWDTGRALWKVRIQEVPWPRVSAIEVGTQLTVLSEAYPALVQAPGLVRALAETRAGRVVDLERALLQLGARNLGTARTRAG